MNIFNKGILLSLLLGGLFIFGCTASAGGQIGTPTPTPSAGNGYTVFVVKDAAANMGSVTSVQMTIDKVEVHSAADGWVTASSQTKTYDLMQLKSSGTAKLLVDAQLKAGTYDQMRLHATSVTVVDANGTHNAKLPSNEFKMTGTLVVKANSTSSATFDFIADESLHLTGNGKYILAPVIQLETRSDAQVDASNSDNVRINGGAVNTNARVGMDLNGNMGVGLAVQGNSNLVIGDDGQIRVTGNTGVGLG